MIVSNPIPVVRQYAFGRTVKSSISGEVAAAMTKARLSSKDLRHVFDFVHELYAPRDSDAFSAHLVSTLSRLVRADVHSYNEVNVGQHHVIYKIAPNDFVQIPNANEILVRHFDQHHYVQHVAATGDGSPRTFCDFVSLRQFKRTDLYQEFYGPMRLPFSLFTDLRDHDPAGTKITIGIHRGGRDFSIRDRNILTLLRPHIYQAMANAQLITRLEANRAALECVTAQASMGALTLTPRNTILWSTPQAATFLKQLPGWSAEYPDQLPAVLLNWIRSVDRGFNFPNELQTPCTPLELACGSSSVCLRLLRKDACRIIVLEEIARAFNPNQLASLGLSKRESEVLSWIAFGKTNEEIALILGARPATIKKHLERIYVKLGVGNRTAAAALAIELARTRQAD